jgi:hypothetical protein
MDIVAKREHTRAKTREAQYGIAPIYSTAHPSIPISRPCRSVTEAGDVRFNRSTSELRALEPRIECAVELQEFGE